MFSLSKSSQLGFSSLFVLVFLVYMKVYFKGEEVQYLKEEAFEGMCINRKRGHMFEGHLTSQEVHQQEVCQSTCLNVH
jgi:hypothetical protein